MNEKLRCQLEEFKEMRQMAFVSAYELNGSGKHIAGIYGANVPREIFWAMDIIPVDVFGIDGSNIKEAEKYMDEKDCSLVKASFGYVITDRCPFSHFASVMAGTDFCTHKESMIHGLEGIKDTYILKECRNAVKLVQECKGLIEFLERKFRVEFDEKRLADVVEKTNEECMMIREITDIYMQYPGIIGCDDLIEVIYGSRFIFDLDVRLKKLKELERTMNHIKEVLFVGNRVDDIKKKILIAGGPVEGMAEELLKPLSHLGNILSVSYCEGENYRVVKHNDDLILGLAEKYIWRDFSRVIKDIAEYYDIDAIINLKFSGCDCMDWRDGGTGLPYFQARINYCSSYDDVLSRIKSFIEGL